MDNLQYYFPTLRGLLGPRWCLAWR
jgi:hypothetical protein